MHAVFVLGAAVKGDEDAGGAELIVGEVLVETLALVASQPERRGARAKCE